MINTKRIKDRMDELHITQKYIANRLHIAAPTVSQKINNIRPLTLEEAKVLTEILKIENEKFGEYFFADEIA